MAMGTFRATDWQGLATQGQAAILMVCDLQVQPEGLGGKGVRDMGMAASGTATGRSDLALRPGFHHNGILAS